MVHLFTLSVNLMGKKRRKDKKGICFDSGLLAKVDTIADEKFSGSRSKLINSALKKYIRENKTKKPINKTQSAQFHDFAFSEFFKFRYANFFRVDK